MDLSCIILSGDLELYVLGMLPAEEANKIAQLATLFPEVQEELDRISQTLQVLSASANEVPSASAKSTIMGKLRELKEEEQKTSVRGAAIVEKRSNENLQTKSTVVSMPGTSSGKTWLLAASTIGLILSLSALVYFISQNKQNQTQLAGLKQQVGTLQNNISTQQQQILAYSQTMQMMHDANYKKIELTNVPGKPVALAQVFWNTKTKEVFIADVSLPKAPLNKQYQLWAIVDGKPVDAGMLSDSKNLAQRMKVFEKAEAFAITLEKQGGNPTPQGEMYVSGKT